MPIKPGNVVVEDTPPLVVDVVELAAVQGPRKDADDEQHECCRQRDEQVQDVHVLEGCSWKTVR